MTRNQTNARITFADEHIEIYKLDNSALRSKLNSKVEALNILTKELDKCRTERDQFKLMAEQIQERYIVLRKKFHNTSYADDLEYSSRSGSNVALLVGELREKNKFLTLELENMRQKLMEAEGDIKVLRCKVNQQKNQTNASENLFSSHQREELVEQLEKSNLKLQQMRADLQAMLDDKEELIKEREAYKCKVHRLNHEMGKLLETKTGVVLDYDALITENRYLHERVEQCQSEIKLSKQSVTKYKSMLESKRRKGTVKFGTNNSDMIMSHKQVKQLLEKGSLSEFPVTAATIADLRSLCLGLLENINDKSLALTHQKRTNKILAARLNDLESRLETVSGNRVTIYPSEILLNGYSSVDVDKLEDMKLDESAEDEDHDDEEEEAAAAVLIVENSEKEVSCCTSSSSNCTADSDKIVDLPPQLQKLVDNAMKELDEDDSKL